MRINLNVPYAEKDQAKRLGAMWDIARKVWYVEDLTNLRPFLKWMPAHLTKPATVVRYGEKQATIQKSVSVSASPAKKKKKKSKNRIVSPVVKRTNFSLRDTGCDCPPWDWCQHNPDPSKLNTAFADGHKPDYRHVARQIEADNMAHIRSILAE